MSLRYAAQKALEALEEYAAEITTTNRGQEAIIALRAGLKEPDWENEYQACVNRHNETLDELRLLEQLVASNQDWSETEALRESLREHMAEIHRLHAAGRQALEALEVAGMSHDVLLISDPPQDAWKARGVSWKLAQAMTALRAALEPVTDCHEKEGDKLAPPLESKDLSEESLNELVAQLKAATADRESRINFTPTHMDFTGDTLDCLKKLADERNADTGKTSDHIPDAGKMVASVREDRTVELGDDEIYDAAHAAYFRGGMPRDAFRLLWANDPAPRFGWDRHDLTDFAKRIASLYIAPKHQDRYETSISAFDTATIKQSLTVEPVRWMVDDVVFKNPHTAILTAGALNKTVEPLYAAPPKHEPLTDEEINALELPPSGTATIRDMVRIVERAHGIGGEE